MSSTSRACVQAISAIATIIIPASLCASTPHIECELLPGYGTGDCCTTISDSAGSQIDYHWLKDGSGFYEVTFTQTNHNNFHCLLGQNSNTDLSNNVKTFNEPASAYEPWAEGLARCRI